MAEDPESGGEKTEDASSRKLDKAREEGQVAKSMEIPSVFVLLGGVIALYATALFFYRNCVDVFHYNFMFERVPELSPADLTVLLIYHAKKMFLMCLPVFAAVFVVALLSNIAQVGFHVSWKAIEPKLSKLNPINGVKQKFTSRALIEFVKSLLKIAVISLVCYLATKNEISNVLTLYDQSTAQILLFFLIKSFWIFIKVCIIMALVAILDYAFQKWKFLEDQKMTQKEVKDERKQTEGDPAVKSKIRQLQMAAARKRMMAEVPEADVVVTNPTHLAVALQYDKKKMDAPTVVAKGAGAVAANIKKIARENDVPIVEDKPLARNLYRDVDIDGQVPFEYYQAVAELLAYVYGLKNG
ncbi:flagellar biosynthesis protein FlhB [Desulfobacter latus]|uniref:Flagellar biosynthetic protein FlhB n=1 Tax=Desulfobacter latus TaxID=2292 RepID=A0A850T5B9_9BACT|nr:flagellar biosynthesis protein FlhB [Desulfobacter latus]NWH04095.1 flagellar biosynthesis protein FlhB [Desulfobacter latus]